MVSMKSLCLALTNSCGSDDNSGPSKGAGGGKMGSWIAGELSWVPATAGSIKADINNAHRLDMSRSRAREC